MPRFIHAGPGGYREWSTITDTYLTPVLTREAMLAHLGEESTTSAARLNRADAHGTSQRNDSRDAGAWEAERCQRCAGFHHPFEGDGVRCTACGEPLGDRQHRPPCQATETGDAAEAADRLEEWLVAAGIIDGMALYDIKVRGTHPIKGDFEFELTPLFKDINTLLSEREKLLEALRELHRLRCK